MNNKKYEIVVARYNENINWLSPFKSITTIYNKGFYNSDLNLYQVINLPNFGRESHTYLYHIINNYDNLADYTIFFQGSIEEHKPLPIVNYFVENDFNGNLKSFPIEKIKNPIEHFGKWKTELLKGSIKQSPITCFEWLKNIISFDHNVQKIDTVWAAIFSVSKKMIHEKPLIFYKDLLRYVDYHPNPEEGHFFERCWYYIFQNNYIKKDIINVYSINELKQLPIQNSKNHYWLSIHCALDGLIKKKFSNITLFPNYYFPLTQKEFSIKSLNKFNIKIQLNDRYYLELTINNNKTNIISLNQTIIYNKPFIKNNNDFINIKFDIDENKKIFTIYLNKSILYEFSLKEYNISELFYFIKCHDYSSILKFNELRNEIYFIKQNDYYNIKMYYTIYYLNYFIQFM
jgi:hypothetical protein